MRRATTFSIFALLLYAVAIQVRATTITLINTNDGGPGSLRQALVDANRGDTITFAVTGTIGLTSAELVIDKTITVSGPGPDMLAVSRTSNMQFRIFHVTASRTVNIEGLTISSGDAQFDYGGGILNDQAALTLTNCSVVNNVASGGGGVYNNDGGSLAIVNCTISGNSAAGGNNPSGGGVTDESLTIIKSTISGNSVVGDFPFTFGNGGGISVSGRLLTARVLVTMLAS